ncbi:MAG: ABC transporter substrate-binding protein [Sulfurifustaceae bacterium]
MSAKYRVRVLSSYIYDDSDVAYARMGQRNRWVNGFVTSLVRARSGLREFDMRFQRTPKTQEELAQIVSTWHDDGVQLAICPGTDSAIRLAAVNDRIPMLYFGAHPENNGLELLNQENVAGIRLNLPLIWSYTDNFALLKEVMPSLERVYFALNLGSEFAFPNVKVIYQSFKRKQTGFWIEGQSPYIGYRSVAFLAERAGVRYFEGPYGPLEELNQGLREADLRNAVLVGFNDTVLNEGATDLLLKFSDAHKVPLVWVNNPSIIERFGVADFSSDFEAIGRIVGGLALDVLRDGKPIGSIPLQEDPGVRRVLNLKRARALGLDIAAPTRTKFHEVIE